MFESINNFLYRHRRKFYIGGGVIGGILLASKYAEYKMFDWHNKQTRLLIEKQKRRQHYEKTRQTANATALNLSSSITKIVTDELDIDDLLQCIRNKPANKLAFWEDLKIQGFSRCMSTIYTSVLVGCIVHAKLMLLGGYSFGDTVKNGKKIMKITPENQEKYLSHLQNFIECGLPTLISKVRKATAHRVQSLSLEKLISLEQLEGIFKDITLLLSGEAISDFDNSDNRFKLPPWSRFITQVNMINAKKNPEDILYYKMTDEMVDVIDSEDFNIVVQNLIQHGINHILDYVADFYPNTTEKQLVISPNVLNSHKHNGSEISLQEENRSSVNELSKTENIEAVKAPTFTRSVIPIAKLVPVLSDLVHPCLSPAPGHLLQFVLLNEELENLCFNIYEAFSVAS